MSARGGKRGCVDSVGHNGCGKSTLLRRIYRALRSSAGLISLDDDDRWGLPAKEAARRLLVQAFGYELDGFDDGRAHRGRYHADE